MKPIAANMPRPSVRPMAVALMKIGLRNSESGMIGSFARDSASTNRTTATTRPAPNSQVSGAPQPWFLSPPKSVKKMRQVVAAESSTTPARSMGFVAFLFGSVSANQAIANAAMPTGMLM